MSDRLTENSGENDMIKAAWQAQPLEAPRISLELVQHHVGKLNKDLREQELLMYFGLAIMIGILPFGLMKDSTGILWTGALLALLGAGYLVLEIRRRGSKIDQASDILQTLDAYRFELERRRDYYRHSWRWSIWPMIPSLLVFLVGGALYGKRPNAVEHSIWMGGFAVVLILLATWDHRRKGHAYQKELDAFETMRAKD